MQPALPGIEMKLETSIRIEPNMSQTFIQATEVNEVKSLPTKDFFCEQNLEKNEKVRVVDFTDKKTKFVIEDLEFKEE